MSEECCNETCCGCTGEEKPICDCPVCNVCGSIHHEGEIHSPMPGGGACLIRGIPMCRINLSTDDKIYSSYEENVKLGVEHNDNSIEDYHEHTNKEYRRNSPDNDVFQPSHYARFRIEPITFIMVNDMPFHIGNIIKYACRAGHKIYPGLDAKESEIKDLEKIRRYAEMRINQLNDKGIL